VYRGDNFPSNSVGDVFVCEPAGNLIRQFAITDDGVTIKATNAYVQSEFLASTDERFRPVNLAVGPDGCLYIADIYRGIIQHRNYVTSYLRQQSLDRGLDKPTGLGRIYRVVAESKPRGPKPNLANATAVELVAALSHPNGWWRDTAQRLLVERNEPSAIDPLKRLVLSNAVPLARLHALWTLEGMRQIDSTTLKAALADNHPQLRAAAIRMSERLLPNHPELTTALLELLMVPDSAVHLQLALTLGQLKDARADAALATILSRHLTNPFVRDAVLTGLAGRELEFLERLLADSQWQQQSPAHADVLRRLSRCVFTEARGSRVDSLLAMAGAGVANRGVAWQRSSMIDGIVSTNFPAWKLRKVRFPSEPGSLAALRRDPELSERVNKLEALLTWAGKPGEQELAIKPLSAAEQKQFDLGKELFLASCAPCHQPHGMGQEGLAPPLVESEWVLGSVERLTRIVLHGVRGKINVGGQTYDLDMPSFGVLDDEQIAAILTCVRRSWDHGADPVDPGLVKSVRTATVKRDEAWSEAELLAVP
jgi:mono/diheme cytochrome c family protein